MADPRVEQYARLLVDTCVDVQPGDQVLVFATPLARPLVEAVSKRIGERGAYALLRLAWGPDVGWANAAPEELLETLPAIERHAYETLDAMIGIDAPENTRELSAVSPERQQSKRRAMAPVR